MEIAGLGTIKKELSELPQAELLRICLRIVKYKKENKELINYLLFEAHDEAGFISAVKSEIDNRFREINPRQLFEAKRLIRKALNFTNKQIRYSGKKRTGIDLLIWFCMKLKHSGLPITRNPALYNLYQRQVLKIAKDISGLHEDLQYDYREDLEQLSF